MKCFRILLVAFSYVVVLGLGVTAGVGAGWGIWGRELTPEAKPIPWTPDVILILGGDNPERAEEGVKRAAEFPAAPVLITGNSLWMRSMIGNRIQPESRITIERHASNTWEDARHSRPYLDAVGARRVLLVTNWFHAKRALGTFRRVQPGREFAVAFSPRPSPMKPWDEQMEKRERTAAVFYLVKYGVWAF